MELLPIQTTDTQYADAERLMTDAFPPEERRPIARQREYTDHNPLFHPHTVMENGKFVGLVNYWTLQGFTYIEHLATTPSLRGKGLGMRVLQQLTSKTTAPIVLEVEPPTDEISVRRIGFYKRCGFTLWEHQKYMQPTYADHLPSIPLLLMVYGNLDEQKDFAHIYREIHTKVYGKQD